MVTGHDIYSLKDILYDLPVSLQFQPFKGFGLMFPVTASGILDFTVTP